MAYILGEWEFYGIPLEVTRDVLIPRMDTEVLVDAALEHFREREMESPRILDLCAGTGCVGLAVAAHLPGARVVLADNSPGALRVCQRNVLKNHMLRRVSVLELDALAGPPLLIGAFDAILCNPPYIPTRDIESLDDSVRLYEPASALDGGEDGLDFFRSIIPRWKTVLAEGGLLAFECGAGQATAVAEMLRRDGFKAVCTHKDTLGIERVVAGIWRPSS